MLGVYESVVLIEMVNRTRGCPCWGLVVVDKPHRSRAAIA